MFDIIWVQKHLLNKNGKKEMNNELDTPSSSSSSCHAISTDIPDPLPPPYHLSLPAGLLDHIQYQHRAAVCRFQLVILPLLVYVKGSTWCLSLMSPSRLLQQCPACLVFLTWIVFVMGDKWLYSWCFVGCCLQDLFNIARSILE